MIRRAKILEIPDIIVIAKACAAHMISKGIYQWNEHYPTEHTFVKDIERNELYVLKIDETIIGMITLSTFIDKEYVPVSWLTENKSNLYVHRLAVHPKHQGKGYAQKLMDFAEDHAKKSDYASIRLDTFSQNPRNQRFYETRGYKRLGNIYFPKQSEHPFYCYELVL